MTHLLRCPTVPVMDDVDAYQAAKRLLDSKGEEALVGIRERIREAAARGDNRM